MLCHIKWFSAGDYDFIPVKKDYVTYKMVLYFRIYFFVLQNIICFFSDDNFFFAQY